MAHYDWPGNVRELQNFLDRYAAFGESVVDSLGRMEDFLLPVSETLTLEEATRQFEGTMILKALERCRWHRGKAAEALGLNLRTLQRRIKKLGLNPKQTV